MKSKSSRSAPDNLVKGLKTTRRDDQILLRVSDAPMAKATHTLIESMRFINRRAVLSGAIAAATATAGEVLSDGELTS